MVSFKLSAVGHSLGFIVPKEVQARLKVEKGDTIYLTEAPDGSFRLTAHNPEFERQMTLAQQIMRQDRDILKALAR
jgi:putative addiction module antidote